MAKRSRHFYDARTRVAEALAHPSRRLLILDAIQEREGRVCELTELVGADPFTVSKHLAVLKNAGIVDDRKDRSARFCRPRIRCLDGLLGCIESALEADRIARAEGKASR